MDPKFAKIRELFLAALEHEGLEEQLHYAEEHCGETPEMRTKLEEMLRAHHESSGFLASKVEETFIRPVTEQPGDTIGPYKLLQQIGEGGMGVVYMAEQAEPVERRVALKIIKPGMDTQQVIARFEAERQALAMMDHPNIAKVLDAGTTDSGRPYFVMELVKGVLITDYCDEQQLTPKERLELFIPICQAVQHAHQKGIIHRDLKPSNILVAQYDGKPVPKVIDFGVAKAISQKLTEKTMFTQYGQIVGTVDYMSPEQAQFNQLDVDTRSDVYSLGVLLYELLTGETPFDKERLRSAAFDELLQIIRDEEPPRPSLKLSSSQSLPTIAANRHIEPQKLSTLVRGELDWIVMKALEKDRNRRYETPSQFAEDVQHYLNDEAVVACPPSAAYKFRKFARRNKVAIGTTSAIAASLIAGIIGTAWQAYEAGKERDRAVIAEGEARNEAERATEAEKLAEERLEIVSKQRNEIAEEKQRAENQAAIAKAVNDFLNNDLLGMAEAGAQSLSNLSPDPDLKVRTLLDRAAEKLDGRFPDQPLVEAAIRETLGYTYYAIGAYHESEEHYQRALELRKQELGDESSATLASMNCLGTTYLFEGRYDEAEKLLEEVLSNTRRTLGDEHPRTLIAMHSLASVFDEQGRYAEAEELLKKTLKLEQRILGEEHPDTLFSMNNLGLVYCNQGFFIKAEQLHQQALTIEQRVFGNEHPATLASMSNLANCYKEQGRYDEAEKLHRKTLEFRQKSLGEEHPDTLASMSNLVSVMEVQSRFVEAEQLIRQVMEIQQRILGKEHPDTLGNMHNLAVTYRHQHRYEEAEELHRQVLEIQQRTLGDRHPLTLHNYSNLAFVYYLEGKYDEAEKLHQKTLDLRREVLGEKHPDTLESMNSLALVYYRKGGYDEAEQLHRQTLELQRQVLGDEHPDTLISMNNLANVLEHLRRWDAAIKLNQEIVRIDSNNAQAYRRLGYAQEKNGDRNAAAIAYRQALKLDAATDWTWNALARVTQADGGHELVLEVFSELMNAGVTDDSAYRHRGKAYQELGRALEAIEDMRHVVELYRKSLAETAGQIQTRESLGTALRDLGSVLNTIGQTGDAESAYREGLEVWKGLTDEFPKNQSYAIRLGDIYRQLGHVSVHQGKCAEALHYFEKALKAAPDDFWSHNVLAGFRLNAKDESFRDPEQAVRHAARAVELNPKQAPSHRHLGEARYRLQDWAGAAESLEKAIELGRPLDARTGFQLAICYGHLDDREKAAEWYEQAVTLMQKQTNPEDWLVDLRKQADEQLETSLPQTVKN